MMPVDRCRCCNRPITSPFRWDNVCENCVRGVFTDLNLMCASDDIRATVDWLTELGCLTMQRYVIGALPFDGDAL
jgi:hypothetical protein